METAVTSLRSSRRGFLKTSTAALTAGFSPYWFTGESSRAFGFKDPSERLVIGCIGTGTARLVSAPLSLNWDVPCGSSADPTGLTFTPPAAALGTSVKVLVTSPAHTRWVFRVDERSVSRKTA